jgi:hypothetical protein
VAREQRVQAIKSNKPPAGNVSDDVAYVVAKALVRAAILSPESALLIPIFWPSHSESRRRAVTKCGSL